MDMTRDEILNMPAGPWMDALVATCKKCGSVRRMTLRTGYTQCLDCHNERNKKWNSEHGSARKWDRTDAGKEYKRDWQLRSRYGITLIQYQEILARQSGTCAICGGRPNGKSDLFCVDHDHKTGLVRGLLCNKCNVGLANYRDNPDLLRSAAEYLCRAALLAVLS